MSYDNVVLYLQHYFVIYFCNIYHKTVPRPWSAGTFSHDPETCPSGIPYCRTWTCPCTGSTRLPETSRTTRTVRPGTHSLAKRCPWKTYTPSGDCTGSCRTLQVQLKSNECHIIYTVETRRYYVMWPVVMKLIGHCQWDC